MDEWFGSSVFRDCIFLDTSGDEKRLKAIAIKDLVVLHNTLAADEEIVDAELLKSLGIAPSGAAR